MGHKGDWQRRRNAKECNKEELEKRWRGTFGKRRKSRQKEARTKREDDQRLVEEPKESRRALSLPTVREAAKEAARRRMLGGSLQTKDEGGA